MSGGDAGAEAASPAPGAGAAAAGPAAAAPTVPAPPELRKALGPWTLWGLGVGYVISGEYFGWNLGLPEGGPWGMLVATAIATALYACFVPAYTELACAIPRAGGAFDFALRSHGRPLAFVAGFAQLVEFVFATPAIAVAIGAYLGLLFEVDPRLVAIGAYVAFTALNAWGVKQAAWFELAVTVVAVAGLVLFLALALPRFEAANLARGGFTNGAFGVAAALPYAIWLYLAIEGVANAAEEAVHPQRDVAIGFNAALVTLVALAVLVIVAAVGVGGWEAVVYAAPGAEPSDSPLPLAIGRIYGAEHGLTRLVAVIGLFGLVASFHGITLAGARAHMELGRAGFGPAFIGRVHARTRTPVNALAVNFAVGVAAILSGRTGDLIALSAFGALTLYVVSLVSFFALRRREPAMPRPFRAFGHPVAPAAALALSAASFALIAWFRPAIFAVYLGLFVVGLALWRAVRRT